MSENGLKTIFVLMGGSFVLALLLIERPDYLSTPKMLGGLIAAQLILAAVCRFKQAFFLALMIAFVWAGTDLPDKSVWLQGRWFVLATGALAGLAIYMKDQNHHFGVFHLVASFCVLSATVSALVSAYAEESLLKAVSLLLLFIYGSSGARLAVPALEPEKFFRGLLLICEFLAYFTAVSYFVFHWEFYGTSNSLGAVMGVVVVPILLWGMLTAQTVNSRRRLGFALLVALLALMSSFARAAICATIVSCLAMCIALRQYRLLAKGIAATMVLAAVAVMFVPRQSEAPQWDGSQSVFDMFVFKGKPQQGAFASRRGPWQQTWEVIKEHPWFGSGFGTSQTGDDLANIQIKYTGTHIDTRVVREHGNSYLAIAEWVGLLGVIPFYSLVGLSLRNVYKVFARMRSTGSAFIPALPAAAVVLAGLVEAGFEDGLFAVGYYLCVLVWALAFILVDLIRYSESGQTASEPAPLAQWNGLMAEGLGQ
jgi:O-antigen ligase